MMLGMPVAYPFEMTTSGGSEAAVFVDRRYCEELDRMQEALAVGMRPDVFDELFAVAEETSAAGWDGEGAQPVLDEAVRHAKKILKALPWGTKAPTIGGIPDGSLTLEWYSSPTRVLSICVGTEEELHFAALIGSTTIHGKDYFVGEGKRAILGLIDRVERG